MEVWSFNLFLLVCSALLLSSRSVWQRPTRTSLLEPIVRDITVAVWTDVSFSSTTQLLQWAKGFYELRIFLHEGKCPEQSMVFGNESIASLAVDQYEILLSLGPDELLIQVEGKVLLAFSPRYRGCGLYSQSFVIRHAGAYHLSVIRLRQRYQAIADGYDFPPVRYDELVSQWITLNSHRQVSAAGERKEKCYYGENRGVWRINEDSAFANLSLFDNLKTAQTFFNEPWTFEKGINLVLPIYVAIEYPISSLNGNCSKKEINQYHWESDGCGWQSVDAATAFSIVQNKRILFSGDSHMRTFANQFIYFLCGVRVPNSLKLPIYSELLKDHSLCKTLQIAFQEDLICDKAALFPSLNSSSLSPSAEGEKEHHSTHARSDYSNKADFLVVNCGHHPAAYARYTLREYGDAVRHHLYRLLQHGYQTTNIFWLESVPEPIRQDSFVFKFRDRRTLDRMRIFNKVAKQIVEEKGVELIPAFHPLLPFANKICDVGHYLPIGTNDPMIQSLLRMIRDM